MADRKERGAGAYFETTSVVNVITAVSHMPS